LHGSRVVTDSSMFIGLSNRSVHADEFVPTHVVTPLRTHRELQTSDDVTCRVPSYSQVNINAKSRPGMHRKVQESQPRCNHYTSVAGALSILAGGA
jgi:hypothetical protein